MKEEELIKVHRGATMVDDRYFITEAEQEKIIRTVFSSVDPLKLKFFSAKEKKKIVILNKIAAQFEKDRVYTEAEVNDILSDIYEDYVTLRLPINTATCSGQGLRVQTKLKNR